MEGKVTGKMVKGMDIQQSKKERRKGIQKRVREPTQRERNKKIRNGKEELEIFQMSLVITVHDTKPLISTYPTTYLAAQLHNPTNKT